MGRVRLVSIVREGDGEVLEGGWTSDWHAS